MLPIYLTRKFYNFPRLLPDNSPTTTPSHDNINNNFFQKASSINVFELLHKYHDWLGIAFS